MVSRQWDGRTEPAVMPPPVPELHTHPAQAPIGLIAALSWEIRPLLRRQPGVQKEGPFRSFTLGGDPVWLAIAGMGAENSFRAAQELLDHSRVRGLVSVGFAGALADFLSPGEIVRADRVLDEQTGEQFDCSPDLFPLEGARRGSLLSAAEVIATAGEKRRRANEWGAIAADLESAGVARAAAGAGIPFCAIKAITDTAAQSISIDFARCRSEHKGLSVRKIAREALRSPRGMADLWMLARGARRAARSLAAALCAAESKGIR